MQITAMSEKDVFAKVLKGISDIESLLKENVVETLSKKLELAQTNDNLSWEQSKKIIDDLYDCTVKIKDEFYKVYKDRRKKKGHNCEDEDIQMLSDPKENSVNDLIDENPEAGAENSKETIDPPVMADSRNSEDSTGAMESTNNKPEEGSEITENVGENGDHSLDKSENEKQAKNKSNGPVENNNESDITDCDKEKESIDDTEKSVIDDPKKSVVDDTEKSVDSNNSNDKDKSDDLNESDFIDTSIQNNEDTIFLNKTKKIASEVPIKEENINEDVKRTSLIRLVSLSKLIDPKRNTSAHCDSPTILISSSDEESTPAADSTHFKYLETTLTKQMNKNSRSKVSDDIQKSTKKKSAYTEQDMMEISDSNESLSCKSSKNKLGSRRNRERRSTQDNDKMIISDIEVDNNDSETDIAKRNSRTSSRIAKGKNAKLEKKEAFRQIFMKKTKQRSSSHESDTDERRKDKKKNSKTDQESCDDEKSRKKKNKIKQDKLRKLSETSSLSDSGAESEETKHSNQIKGVKKTSKKKEKKKSRISLDVAVDKKLMCKVYVPLPLIQCEKLKATYSSNKELSEILRLTNLKTLNPSKRPRKAINETKSSSDESEKPSKKKSKSSKTAAETKSISDGELNTDGELNKAEDPEDDGIQIKNVEEVPLKDADAILAGIAMDILKDSDEEKKSESGKDESEVTKSNKSEIKNKKCNEKMESAKEKLNSPNNNSEVNNKSDKDENDTNENADDVLEKPDIDNDQPGKDEMETDKNIADESVTENSEKSSDDKKKSKKKWKKDKLLTEKLDSTDSENDSCKKNKLRADIIRKTKQMMSKTAASSDSDEDSKKSKNSSDSASEKSEKETSKKRNKQMKKAAASSDSDGNSKKSKNSSDSASEKSGKETSKKKAEKSMKKLVDGSDCDTEVSKLKTSKSAKSKYDSDIEESEKEGRKKETKKKKKIAISDSEDSKKTDGSNKSSELNSDAEKSEKEKPKKKTKKKKKIVISDSDCSKKSDASNKSSESKNSDSDSDSEKSEEERPKKKPTRRRIKRTKNSSSDEDDDKSTRKHIRKVLDRDSLSATTIQAESAEKERKARIAEKQKKYNQILENMKESVVEDLILEYDEENKKDLLPVHKHFIEKLKPHQASGVRFMWDACFESLEMIKKGKGGGCVLAHCMGLGKTLQVITLTHTLLSNSKKTQVEKVMVVCPISTVLNWKAEFKLWMPKRNDIEIVEMVSCKNYERQYRIQEWNESGGVLIIGYTLFTMLTNPKNKKLSKKMRNIFYEGLVDPGPDLVVCDEGHLLKNEKTNLSVAMNRIKTQRRIVLTGTPLQNNLKEYWCMVQFIKPNLLGTYKEYMNRFVNPITNGQYTDSTQRDIVLMRKRSHVLHKLLDGVVQRRDYSVLAPYLPPKHEYVLFINLSEVQIKIYKEYMKTYARKQGTSSRMSFLFKDFQILQRICTHPRTLLDRSRDVKNKEDDEEDSEGSLKDFIDDKDDTSSSSSSKSSHSGSDSDDNNENKQKHQQRKRVTRAQAAQENGSDSDIEEIKEIKKEWWQEFCDGEELDNIKNSGKLFLLFQILKECEEIGDKILVFSQSLFTLNCIEYFLEKIDEATQDDKTEKVGGFNGSWALGLDYFRLDGSSSCDNRALWCNMFNSPNNLRARLFLISTKAGGLGINLVAANRVVIFDVSWNPSHDIQSIYRVYRFGQTKPSYIYRFVTYGCMEMKIYERQVTKQAISKRVIDEQQIDRHYNQNDLMELYKCDLEPQERPLPMVPKDVLLGEMLMKHEKIIYKYHEHQSLLENKESEELNEEERKAAWDEFENEKVLRKNTNPGLVNLGNNAHAIASALTNIVTKDNPTWTQARVREIIPALVKQLQVQLAEGDTTMYSRVQQELAIMRQQMQMAAYYNRLIQDQQLQNSNLGNMAVNPAAFINQMYYQQHLNPPGPSNRPRPAPTPSNVVIDLND